MLLIWKNNIKYFDKGGFSIIYKATYNAIEVVLKYFKYFNNLNENLKEFLDKWKIINFNSEIINILGFTKNPDTSDYILIIEYANKNNLRKCLTEIANTWKQKLFILYKIINGERPEIIENTPQCYIDLMKKCWNENPLKRPSAQEVVNIISNWIYHPYENGNNNLIIESHPQAYYTSRLLDFTSKEVNEILESKCLDCIVEDSIKSSNIEADETN
ncbi:kinase-like domain-containing protein [Rhizophagus clarus]|uniref:Kinase-like domain-containing protein n=1 Tax=Rhizophagus clarus TaxID=94130 RepID=A0A8H3LY55_9GLOM|nr:kinase-like domain-containing protein [Rhizophagus clarus]